MRPTLTPADDALLTDVADARPPLSGLDALVLGCAGWWQRRRPAAARGLEACAGEAERAMEACAALSDPALRHALFEARRLARLGRLAPGEADVLGSLGEAARRKLRLRPYRVQLMAAAALRGGFLAEMATGEGKTLAIALAAVPHGWHRAPCHVITANDYLARRDARALTPFYEFCGVTVAAVTADMDPARRREAYACDVVYTTAKELVADFLRDRLRLGEMAHAGRRAVRRLRTVRATPVPETVTRGLSAAIVDEADSLLIDEAVTPLLISRAQESSGFAAAVEAAAKVAGRLTEGDGYAVDFARRSVELRPGADGAIAEAGTGLDGAFRSVHWLRPLVVQAVQARLFYHRGRQYVVRDRKVVIVDEYSGRLMPGRSWKGGLHQAVEAKEGVPVTEPAETLARISYQRFFRLFRSLAGITGTAQEAAGEFWRTYRLPFVRIPTHRPLRREVWPERVFAGGDAKWDAVVAEIESVHADGPRPVLVGTRSVAASEHLAGLLQQRKLAFRLLNAVRSNEEAAIIAGAGQPKAITIATNMAGRGTDIVLGQGVAAAGGLHVVATERHDARRIDRQLFGRAGRQGDPGSARLFASMADDLVVHSAPVWAARPAEAALRRGWPGARGLARFVLRWAQARSQRRALRRRRRLADHDDWLDRSFGSGARLRRE